VKKRRLESASWRVERLGDALAQLARACRLSVRPASFGAVPAAVSESRAALDAWLDAAALAMGIELDAVGARFGEVAESLRAMAPAIVRLGADGSRTFAVLLRVRAATAVLLSPDGRRVRLPLAELARAARGAPDAAMAERVDGLLDRANVPPSRRPAARDAMLEHLFPTRMIDVGWAMALPPSAPFARQLREAGVFRAMRATALAQLGQQALAIASWWLIGRGALEGQIARGWIVAWGLVLLSAIPLRAAGTWAQGNAGLRFAIVLKRRLLNGALRLNPEEMRDVGSGELLGRVIESGAMESLVTTGGIAALLAIVEVIVATLVLATVPGGAPMMLGFAACVALVMWMALRVRRRLGRWTHERLRMTRDLVERMIGHRTRLAQQPREQWHEGEDEQLASYAERSSALDRAVAWTQAGMPTIWLVLGAVTLTISFVQGASAGATLAVLIGGLLLGQRAIAHLTSGLAAVLRASVAWRETRSLFEAGGREERAGSPAWAAARGLRECETLLEARDLHFAYPGRHQPVLRGISLQVGPRDRLLLQGASGGGKSTLGALVTGLRDPDAGLLLLGGLDRRTLGDGGWRKRIVAAPQFHENHVIGATLAFNLLMGRSWPPRHSDLQEAREVCEDLGLGALLNRMPSGLMQMVGETGWQLSHGEKSRVFIARALLQLADMIVLDESFAALDPETLERALGCVQRRAPALLVIAHP
jgi:ATP-binding cassette subfamily B protein